MAVLFGQQRADHRHRVSAQQVGAEVPQDRERLATWCPPFKELPGLISYHAGTSPDGSVVHVSFWKSDEHAQQMSRLKEMIVDTRQAYEKAGVTLTPSSITRSTGPSDQGRWRSEGRWAACNSAGNRHSRR
jgi:hypothetical protein